MNNEMEDFKTWFDANKSDVTNEMHRLVGVTCELAKGKQIRVSINPEVENSWCVSNNGEMILMEGTLDEAAYMWNIYENGK